MELCIKNTIVLFCFVSSHKNLTFSKQSSLACLFQFPKESLRPIGPLSLHKLCVHMLFFPCSPCSLVPLFPCSPCSPESSVPFFPLFFLFPLYPCSPCTHCSPVLFGYENSTCFPRTQLYENGNHDFPGKIMALTFCLVAYPFLRGKRQFTRKTTTLHTHHAFLYILLLSLHDYDVKMLNFSYCGGRELKTKTLFFFSRTSLHYFRIQLQKTILAGMERF